jgi:cytochrome c biogenesis protein CcdA
MLQILKYLIVYILGFLTPFILIAILSAWSRYDNRSY